MRTAGKKKLSRSLGGPFQSQPAIAHAAA